MKKLLAFGFCCSFFLYGVSAQEKKYYFNSNRAYTLTPEMFDELGFGGFLSRSAVMISPGVFEVKGLYYESNMTISPKKIAKGTTSTISVTIVEKGDLEITSSGYETRTHKFQVYPVNFKLKDASEKKRTLVCGEEIDLNSFLENTPSLAGIDGPSVSWKTSDFGFSTDNILGIGVRSQTPMFNPKFFHTFNIFNTYYFRASADFVDGSEYLYLNLEAIPHEDLNLTAGEPLKACFYEDDGEVQKIVLTNTGENPKGGRWHLERVGYIDLPAKYSDGVAYFSSQSFSVLGSSYDVRYRYDYKGCTYEAVKKLAVYFFPFRENDYRIGKSSNAAGVGEALNFKVEPNTEVRDVLPTLDAPQNYTWSWEFGDGARAEACASFNQSYIYAKEGVNEVICEMKNKKTGCAHTMRASVAVSADPKDSPEASLLQKIHAERAVGE